MIELYELNYTDCEGNTIPNICVINYPARKVVVKTGYENRAYNWSRTLARENLEYPLPLKADFLFGQIFLAAGEGWVLEII